jgi:hypothetical protein
LRLREIKTNYLTIGFSISCPETGAFEAWKKCKEGVIVHLLIPAEAKRSSATTRKCRCEFAHVIEVIGAEAGITEHDGYITEYKTGSRVDSYNGFNKYRWVECGEGIHFFMNREDAENY